MYQKMRFWAFCRKSNHEIGTFYCWNKQNKVSANILRKPHVREKSCSEVTIFAVDPKWPKMALLNDPSNFFFSKPTLTLLLKCWEMVDNIVRNNPWKFQVQKNSGSKDIIFAADPKWPKMALLNDPSVKIFDFFVCSKSLRILQFAKKR